MGKEFSIEPRDIPRVETKFRKIVTPLPVPESLPVLEKLRSVEPISMRGMPPVVWHHAEDIQVYDAWGNQWLDWSSGVLVTNAGHCAPEIKQAVIDQANKGLLHNYVFPSAERAELVELLQSLAPKELQKVFLLTTGSEATECAIKLARTNGFKKHGREKVGIVGCSRGFHGRTMGSQQAGGIPGQKEWIVNLDPAIVNVPFPDGYWTEDTSFDYFLKSLEETGMSADKVAGVIVESFQGVGPDFAPVEYVKALREWCTANDIVLIFDEVQAGCGRSGKFWAFEHYDVVPDIICVGKGVTSSLPLSAVIGREDIVNQYPPGSMTSTHTGNPICVAAALANLRLIKDKDLVGNAAKLGPILLKGLEAIQAKHPEVVGRVAGRGLVAGMQMVVPGEKKPNHDLAFDIILRCFHKGLLLFAPVGAWGQTVKICPPLTITQEALEDGLSVLAECVDEAVAATMQAA